MAQRRSDGQFNLSDLLPLIGAVQRLPPGVQLAIAALMILGGLFVAVAVAVFALSRNAPTAGPVAVAGSPQMWLGNPSNAAADPDNFLMVKPYFALSYDRDKGTPNWVSWRLTGADVGTSPRAPEFAPDLTLPPGFARITTGDYRGGGFDRGHMCPHGDRSADPDMSYATFVMTNVVPQAANLNQKAWDQEEEYCRDLARRGHRLYVIDGPAGRGGVGKFGLRDTIAGGRVVVPSDCWKVVLILDDDGTDPDPATITPDARVLTVDMPNDQNTVDESWSQYRTTPAEVERRTGLRFFDRLRPDVADALRQRLDRTPLPPPRMVTHGYR